MRLKEWAEAGGRYTQLQLETGLAWSTVYAIAIGAVSPQIETAKKISAATNGEVTVEEIAAAFDPALAAKRREKEAKRRAKMKRVRSPAKARSHKRASGAR
jgi:hypothetical protein